MSNCLNALRTLADISNDIKRIVIALLGMCLVALLAYVFTQELRITKILIEPISVPDEFIEMGYTDRVMANRIVDAMRLIENPNEDDVLSLEPTMITEGVSRQLRFFAEPAGIRGLHQIEIASSGVSVAAAIQQIKQLIGRSDYVVRVEITRDGRGNNMATIRLPEDRDLRANIDLGDLDSSLLIIAKWVYRKVRPTMLARYYYYKKDFDSTAQILDQLSGNSSQECESESRFLRGNMFLRQSRWREAFQQYSEILESDPHDYAALINSSVVLEQMRESKTAKLYLQRAARINPRNINTKLAIGNALYREGKKAEAVHYFREALTIKPRSIEVLHNLGVALGSLGHTNEALAHLKRGSMLFPRQSSFYSAIGAVFLESGNVDSAVFYFKEALDRNAKDPVALMNWGILSARGRNWDFAKEKFSEVLRVSPDDPDAAMYVGMVLSSMGQYSEAESLFERSYLLNPQFAPNLINWASSLMLRQNAEQAGTLVRQALEIDPKLFNGWIILGDVYRHRKAHLEAIVCYRRANLIGGSSILS